jgi:hypothetical protein
VFCKVIGGSKGLSAASQRRKSYMAKYKELITQVFCVTLSFKSFLVVKLFKT